MRLKTEHILKCFREYWMSVFTHDQDKIDLQNLDINSLAEVNEDNADQPEISCDEVKKALQKVKPNKATGLDDISPALLCDRNNTLTTALKIVFNEILQSGKFPKKWKTDRRKPIFKSGDRTSVNNYRLLAIHSIFRKIFCTVLLQRLTEIVSLDDAQNGFRQNRRGTDNALIIHNMIRQARNKQGCYIIVIDFSKAFDRCHIPTLIKKLSKKNVRGNTLRTIKDMYTDTKAQLSINGILGEPFDVTRGVAQGCTLSPLFFDIYIDDLLVEFRDRGLGVPVGAFIQGSSSFADDLALLATDMEMVKEYLSLLKTWRNKNFFTVNTGKSGILRVGALGKTEFPNISLEGDRIRLLGEPDPQHEEIKTFNYLGFIITPGGEWDEYLKHRVSRCNQTLGRYWRFFKKSNISVDLKLRISKTMILSHLSYGSDILCPNPKQCTEIDSMQAKVLKRILQIPRTANSNAVRYILGQSKLTAEFQIRRVTNLHRIRSLNRNTRLREIYDQRVWHKGPHLFQFFERDEIQMRNSLKLTNITQEEFDQISNRQPNNKSKSILKEISLQTSKLRTSHILRINHPELIEGIRSTHTNPAWKRSSLEISRYARWLVGGTRVQEDLKHRYAIEEMHCRFCGDNILESRAHLLVDCKGTQKFRNEFVREVHSASPTRLKELQDLPLSQRWVWILAGGTTRELRPDPLHNNRILPEVSPIYLGKSVPPVKDKTDEDQCLVAYEEYLEIISALPTKHIRVYTDGSHSRTHNSTGFGVKIIKQEGTKSSVIHTYKQGLASATNNAAEITAIHHAMSWLYNVYDNLTEEPIHIFTDSKYALNACSSTNLRRKNFHIIQEIQNYAYKFKHADSRFTTTLHFVPSHIENTGKGKTHTGNYYADKLANEGRIDSEPENTSLFIENIREKILDATLNFIKKIDDEIEIFDCESTPRGPPAVVADDFDASIDAVRDSLIQGIS